MQFRSWREYIMWGRVLGSSRQWHVLCRAVNGTLQSFTIHNSLLKVPTSARTHDAQNLMGFRTWRQMSQFHIYKCSKAHLAWALSTRRRPQRRASLSIVIVIAKSRWQLYYYVCGTIRGHWPLPRPRWVNKLQCLIILTSARQCSNVPTPHLAAWHRGHWGNDMDPSGLVSQEHVDITCVGPTLTWLAFKLKLLRQLNNRKR